MRPITERTEHLSELRTDDAYGTQIHQARAADCEWQADTLMLCSKCGRTGPEPPLVYEISTERVFQSTYTRCKENTKTVQ